MLEIYAYMWRIDKGLERQQKGRRSTHLKVDFEFTIVSLLPVVIIVANSSKSICPSPATPNPPFAATHNDEIRSSMIIFC